jgi:type I restriction enzyme S subunit
MKFNTVKLGEYLYIKGRIGWKGLKKKEYLDKSDFRIINGESLTENGIDWNKAGYISKERYDESPEIMLQPDDILISKDGTIGKIGYIDSLNTPTTVASGIFVIRNQKPEIINTRFIYHFFCSKYFKNFITMRTEGSVIPHLYQKDFVDLDFPLPELSVQDKIVGILDAICNKIDLNKSINENLEQQISSIYANLCENKSWDSCELGSLIEVRDGTHDSPKPQSDGYLLVTSKHLLPYGVDRITPNRIAEKDFKKINERSLVEPGDVLMSMIGTIGLISFVADQTIDYAIKNVALFKTSKTPELAYYFLTFLKSKKTQQYIEMCLAGSTQKYISLGELRKMPIPDPAVETLESFNKIVRPMYQTIILNTQENNAFAELRDSLLPKLISGDLDISEIDI